MERSDFLYLFGGVTEDLSDFLCPFGGEAAATLRFFGGGVATSRCLLSLFLSLLEYFPSLLCISTLADLDLEELTDFCGLGVP